MLKLPPTGDKIRILISGLLIEVFFPFNLHSHCAKQSYSLQKPFNELLSFHFCSCVETFYSSRMQLVHRSGKRREDLYSPFITFSDLTLFVFVVYSVSIQNHIVPYSSNVKYSQSTGHLA